MNPAAQKAFSLLELAIVITIIGLIIGVVMSGSTIIRSAEMRSVISDTNAYILAVNNFKQQYRYLPGDFLNASAVAYWPSSGGGDGSGTITGAERFRAWQHLGLAGLIDKKLTGTDAGTDSFVIGTNVPESKYRNGGFGLYNDAVALATATTTTYADASYGNMLTFGASAGADSGPPIRAIMEPTDAYNIDLKIDDGKPGTGKWIANLMGPSGAAAAYNFGGASSCSTDANGNSPAATNTYRLNITTVSCSFFIKTGL